MVMFPLSLEQPSILYVPRVKEQPGSTHNIPPTLNAWLLPWWPSLANDWLMLGGRGWWGLDGGLSRTLLSYASVLSRKRAGSKQERTKMMVWEMGVIWGLQGEGHKWRTEEGEQGGRRGKRGGLKLSNITLLTYILSKGSLERKVWWKFNEICCCWWCCLERRENSGHNRRSVWAYSMVVCLCIRCARLETAGRVQLWIMMKQIIISEPGGVEWHHWATEGASVLFLIMCQAYIFRTVGRFDAFEAFPVILLLHFTIVSWAVNTPQRYKLTHLVEP